MGLATIRALTIFREANPPPLFNPDDKTVIIKIGPEDRQLDRLQTNMEQRLQPNGMTRQALALIARLGDAFEQPDPEQAVEALGLVIAHAAVIARIGHLGIGPIIDLGVALRRSEVQPAIAGAKIARAILGRIGPALTRDMDRERMLLVEALGYAIAKAIDDVEIGHDVEVRDARELFTRIAGEVEAGKLPRAPAAAATEQPRDNRPAPVDPARKAEALAQLQAAAEVIDAPVNVPVEEIQRRAREEPTARHRKPTVLEHNTGRETVRVVGPPGADPSAMAAVMERELAHAAVRQAEEDAFMSTVATEGFAAAITKHKPAVDPSTITGLTVREASAIIRDGAAALVPRGEDIGITRTKIYEQHIAPATAEERRLGVSAATVCPQCGAPMAPSKVYRRDGAGRAEIEPAGGFTEASDLHGDIYLCSNGHEHHAKHLAALRANSLAAAQETVLPPGQAPVRPVQVERSGRHFPAPRRK